jgi:ferritin-like metal-binding protein YciE
MPISTTQEKFVHELADLYDAEHQFLEGQRQMQQKASDEKLRALIMQHIGQTEQQIKKLEQVFGVLGEEPKRQPCSGAKGLVEEAAKVMQEAKKPELCDALIGGAAAKVEHYEMVSYSDLISSAELMGQRKAVTLLKANRDQEVSTARKMERAGPRLLKLALSSEGKKPASR